MTTEFEVVQNERRAVQVALGEIERTGDVSRSALRKAGISDTFWNRRYGTFQSFRTEVKNFGKYLEYDFCADLSDLIGVHGGGARGTEQYEKARKAAYDILVKNSVVYGGNTRSIVRDVA